MVSLVPFVVGLAAADLVLLSVFARLHRAREGPPERREHLRRWAWAHGLDALRQVMVAAELTFGTSLVLSSVASLAHALGAWFLLDGALRFASRRSHVGWALGAALAGSWGAIARAVELPFALATVPTSGFLGLARVAAGIVLLRSPGAPSSRILASSALILWGVHTWNYPFARELDWFAPWGFQIATTLATCIGIGMLLLHLERARIEERRLREELAQAQRMEALGRMAGGIAHDFNNALGAITASADLARVRLSRGEGAERELDDVRDAAMRAADLTRQLLALARRQPIEPQPLDLEDAVSAAARVLGRVLGERIPIELALSGGSLVVLADPGQIDHVVMNLALNSRDAMPLGGTLRIATSRVEIEGREHARLRVEDTGVGMDEQTRRHMFDPFFTTKMHGGGNGLGLSMVYGVVTQNGGHIEVESTPGHGTRIDVLLPIVAGAPAPVRPIGPRPSDAPRRRARILVVEDEAALRRAVEATLRDAGHDVRAAGLASEALEQLRAFRPDLIVTDVVMPGLSGPELARAVREHDPLCPVVFVTGYAPEPLEVVSGGDPMLSERSQLLVKPFTMDALLAAIARALDRRDADGSTRPPDRDPAPAP